MPNPSLYPQKFHQTFHQPTSSLPLNPAPPPPDLPDLPAIFSPSLRRQEVHPLPGGSQTCEHPSDTVHLHASSQGDPSLITCGKTEPLGDVETWALERPNCQHSSLMSHESLWGRQRRWFLSAKRKLRRPLATQLRRLLQGVLLCHTTHRPPSAAAPSAWWRCHLSQATR